MAGLSHLRDVYEKNGRDFLNNLLNKKVIINEKTNGSYFAAKKNSSTGRFDYFKKDAKIGHVDRVLSRHFEPAITHFEGLTPDSVDSIPENYVFGFDYNSKNGTPLTLTHIKVLDEGWLLRDVIHEKATLDKWSDLLGVKRPNIIFEGTLNDDQRAKVLEFVYTPANELSEKFKTVSFTKHIISTLNPRLNEDSKFNPEGRDFDEIVFRFYESGSNKDENSILAKLVDPVFYENSKSIPEKKVAAKSDEYVWIIVTDLMNFVESFRMTELMKMSDKGETPEERYVSLVNNLFREFIDQYGDKYSDLDIQVPDFLTRPEFDINLELVGDPVTMSFISKNSNYKEIYRIFMNMFRKKKIKVNSILFTDRMKTNLETQVKRLEKASIREAVLENYFPTFREFVGDDAEPGYFETFNRTEDEAKSSKVKKVNLILSEFQPFNNSHVKTAKLLKEKNGLPSLLVGVHPGKSGKAFPFKSQTVGNLLGKVSAADPDLFAGHVMLTNGNIESILSGIKPGYEPVVIASNPSRIRDLALQLELAKKRSRNLNIRRDVVLAEMGDPGIESSVVSFVREKNFSKFKENMPTYAHGEFYNLNKDLYESNEDVKPVLESVEVKLPVEPIITIED